MMLILLWTFLLVLKIASGSVENSDSETEEEVITEAELLRIAAEDHVQDPLNSFYDPFEPYRILSYAYWNPITNPQLHKNPKLPPNFIPPNAPPKILPTDFFFGDGAARQIVLEEHAAAFCPFLRRWRETNPLKPYPVDHEFSKTHPPIKFTPGIGYEIDKELDWLGILSRQATDEFARKFTLDSVAKKLAEAAELSKSAVAVKSSEADVFKSGAQSQPLPKSPEDLNIETDKNNRNFKFTSKRTGEFDILLSKVDEVKRNRSDCRKYENFTAIPPPLSMNVDTPSCCLQEVIFLMEEYEDRNSPIERESKIPDIVAKVEHFRQILIGLEANDVTRERLQLSRKCPFGFKSTKKKTKTKPEPKPKIVQSKTIKFYKGTVPKFAELEEGEEIFPSQTDSEYENVTKYVFPYKLVPFPSIQNTLKKYVSI